MPAEANDSRTASDKAVVCKELLGDDIDLFAFRNDTGEMVKFKASDYMGVGILHDKQSGLVYTNYGPAPWNHLSGQHFYDSEEHLFQTLRGDGI